MFFKDRAGRRCTREPERERRERRSVFVSATAVKSVSWLFRYNRRFNSNECNQRRFHYPFDTRLAHIFQPKSKKEGTNERLGKKSGNHRLSDLQHAISAISSSDGGSHMQSRGY